MSENPRIEDLRRRVQKDPASIAFAQLAEEYRRAGQHQEAVEVCRAGLAIHPGYLSARVTLGRALLELQQLNAARGEFETVLKGAPENLAAVRGLAEVFHRSGALAEALVQYRAALSLARNDPDLEQTVGDLTRQLAPKKGPLFDPDAPAPVAAPPLQPTPAAAVRPPTVPPPAELPRVVQAAPVANATPIADAHPSVASAPNTDVEATKAPPAASPEAATVPPKAEAQVKQTIEALEQWLDAIHVSRSDRSS